MAADHISLVLDEALLIALLLEAIGSLENAFCDEMNEILGNMRLCEVGVVTH